MRAGGSFLVIRLAVWWSTLACAGFPIASTLAAPAATILAAGVTSSSSDIGAASTTADAYRCGKEKTAAAALTCLLGGITFHVPPIHVNNIKDGIALDIDGLSCKNFALDDLEISFSSGYPSREEGVKSTETVKATISGVTVACGGHVKLSHVPVIKSLSADVKLAISKLQLSIEAHFNNGDAGKYPELPTSASITVPTTDPTPDLSLSLSLSGSFVAEILNLIGKSLLESTIRSSILSALKTDVPNDVGPLLSGAIANVSRLVIPYLKPPPAKAVPTDTSKFPVGVDLNNVVRWDKGVAGEIFPAVSEVLSDISEDTSPLVNHIMDFLGFFLGWPSGSLVVNINQTIHLGNNGLTYTNITLANMTLHGLDTISAKGLKLFRPKASGAKPSADYQLSTVVSIPRLIVTVDAVVSMAPSSIVGKGEGRLDAPASIVIDLTNLGLDLDVLLAFDYDPFKKLQLGQMLEPGCLASALAAINVSKLDFRSHLTPEHPPVLQFLSPGIGVLANQLISVIDGLYADVLSESIRGILAVPIRDFVNQALSEFVLKARLNETKAEACKPMPNPTGKLPHVAMEISRDDSTQHVIEKTPSALLVNGNDVPLDLVNNPLFALIFAVVDVLFAVDGTSPVQYSVNDAVRVVTNGSGAISLGEKPDGSGSPLISVTNMSIMNLHLNASVDSFVVQGLDNISVLSLSAVNSSTLAVDVSMGSNFFVELDVSFSLVVDALGAYGSVLHDGTPPLTDASESMSIRLSLPNGRITTDDLEALVDATALAALDVAHLTSSLSCIASTFSYAKLGSILLRSDNATLDLRCSAGQNGEAGSADHSNQNFICTPGFAKLSALLSEQVPQAQLVHMIGQLLLDAIDAKMGQPAVHLLNDILSNFTRDSPEACQRAYSLSHDDHFRMNGSSKDNSHSDSDYTGIYPVLSFWLGFVSFALFAFAILTGCFMHYHHISASRRKAKPSQFLKNGGSNKSPLLDPTNGYSESTMNDVSSSGEPSNVDLSSLALVNHPGVPAFARWSVPIFLVSAMFMYASGNTTVGASVNVNVQVADLNVTIPPVFDFSLGNSIRDMWSAKVYPLALLILVFSGIWPYVKLVMMLCCWFIPPGKGLSAKRRGIWLEALDALGKWSLIDTFVLVMMMVAFRFHIENQKTWDFITFLPDEFLVVDVIVGPGWGIFAFIIATVISLVSTHVVIAFHRAAVSSVLDAEDTKSKAIRRYSLVEESLQRRQSLMNHEFSYRNSITGFTHARCTTFGKTVVVVLIVTTFSLAVWGSIIDSFSFEFQGLAGTLLGQPPTYYSLVSLANSILPPGGLSNADSGTITLWFTFLLFACAFPLIYLILLMCLWSLPLSLYWHRKLHVTVEVIHAWGSLEVFVLSIVAALLELKQFAGFIVGSKCDAINRFVTLYLSEALPLEDRVCFTVITKLTHGTFVLVGASLLIILVGQYIMRTSHHAIEDRHRRDSGKRDEDRVVEWGLPPNRCTDFSQVIIGKLCLMQFEKRFNFDSQAVNASVSSSIVKSDVSERLSEENDKSSSSEDVENQADTGF